MGKILSLCNQKGGVGKTTVSVNLGIGLAREGQKVLLVDADPQGSMTASLGFVEPDDIGRTLATVMEELMEDKEIDPFDGILHHEEGVDLVPANIELAGLDVALVNAISRETVMKSYLEELRDSYDWIIIDCMHNPEYPESGTIILFHRHSGDLPYHYQKREKSLRSAVRYIRKHDRFQMNGRKW